MSYQNDVADFMKAGEQPVRSDLSLEGDQATLYMNLISEEYQETLSAFKTNDMIEVLFAGRAIMPSTSLAAAAVA